MSVKLFPNSLVIIWLHMLTKLLSSNYINQCTAPTQFVSSTLIVTLNLIDAINLRCSPLQHFFERYPFLGDFTFVFLGQVITWVNQPPNPTFGVRDENVTFKWDYKLNVGDKLDVLFFKRREPAGMEEIIMYVASSKETKNYNSKFVMLKHANSSFLLINAQESDATEYCCRILTAKSKGKSCVELKILGKSLSTCK